MQDVHFKLLYSIKYHVWCICTGPAAEPAMEIAASLVEQFLPELMVPLADKCGSNLDMAEMMRLIDCLAGELGMQRAEQ